MSIPFAIRGATRTPTITKDATLKQKPSPTFLRFIFQSNPDPINCCTHETTREYFENCNHPYHIKTARKLAAFDRNKLHWSAHAHIEVSKKKVVRSWVKRRVEEAIRAELKERGWAPDGTVLERDTSVDDTEVRHATSPLKGALRIYMATDRRKEVVTATGEDVRRDVRAILNEVVRRQSPMSYRAKKAQNRRPLTPRGPS